MNAIFRFFSKRFRRSPSAPAPSHVEESVSVNKSRKLKKSDLECKVAYLDGTEQTFYVSKSAKGSELIDIAFAYVALIEEKDYFGLQFVSQVPIWLDPTKEIRKQYKSGPSFLFALKVKFFASDPHNLHDEYTRYLVVLQLREEIHKGTLACADLQLGAELAALLLQAEFGDFDKKQHTPVFVSTFRFLPEVKQTEEFELTVLDKYKALAGRNLTPAAAESIYLEKVSLLPDYGVEMHSVKGKDNQLYSLGLTPTGILVYEGQNKIGLFFWPKILKLEMKKNKLKLLVTDEDEKSHQVTEHAFCFVLPNDKMCKILWKSAVEHHAFFRLTDRAPVEPKRKQLFRLRSRFHPSFNTEYQLHNLNMFGSSSFRRRKKTNAPSAPSSPLMSNSPAAAVTSSGQMSPSPGKSGIQTVSSTPSFRRVPSKRFNSRPSFSKRDNIEDKREKRERLIHSREQTRQEFFNESYRLPTTNKSTKPSMVTTENSSIFLRRERENPTPQELSSPLRTKPPPPLPISQHIISKTTPHSNSSKHSNAPSKPPRKPEVQNNITTNSKHAISAGSKQCFEYTV